MGSIFLVFSSFGLDLLYSETFEHLWSV